MNRVAFWSWLIPFGIIVYLVFGVPSSLFDCVAFVVIWGGAGFYGIFVCEVTKYVIQEHPIQTVFYVSLISGIFLSLFIISVLSVAALPAVLNFQGDSYAWIVLNFVLGLAMLIPHSAIGTTIAMVLCLLFPSKLNRRNAPLQPETMSFRPR